MAAATNNVVVEQFDKVLNYPLLKTGERPLPSGPSSTFFLAGAGAGGALGLWVLRRLAGGNVLETTAVPERVVLRH
jgi:hypothetical protein